MKTIRIWTLESDNDAEVVGCLAAKLATHLQIGNLSIQASGKRALLRRAGRGGPLNERLKRATRNYLKEEACAIFVIDQDSPMALHQRLKEPHSLINQILAIINEPSLTRKAFLALAVQELEAWLLIDCLGILYYFTSETEALTENERDKTSTNPLFAQLVDDFQEDNTEDIVEEEIGGSGPKEYLIRYSEAILRKLNPNIRQIDIYRRRYRSAMSPAMANHVEINEETLSRNNSLSYLGEVLAQFD